MRSGTWWRRAVVAGSAALMLLGTAGLRAEDAGGGTERAVRLSNVEGQVQVVQGSDVLADNALANTPLFEGTQISTGGDGRAEIQFEDGSVARIPPDSVLTLNVLKPGETEISLETGMGYFELQDGGQFGPMRVRFGDNLVTASGFTVLRVRLDEGPGELAVFSGNAHIDGTNGASMDVKGGESVALNNLNLSANIEPDSWDAWNSDRDQAMTTADLGAPAAASGAANSDNPAWSELNSSGTWYDVPDQGYVWSPYEASNSSWDPYGMGYWMFTPRYGYVWVSGYSWGYMPYQCGAWNWYNSFGWGWAPGACNPWWGGGGWGFTIGYMPGWYRLPVRPHPPRPRPQPLPPVKGGPIVRYPIGLRPVVPIVTVRRTEPTSPIGDLPPRVIGHPILIGGVVAHPVMPTAPREGIHRPINAGPVTNPVRPVNPGGGVTARPVQPGNPRQGYPPSPVTGAPRQGYTPTPVQRPGYQPTPQPVNPGGVRTPAPGAPTPRTPSAPVYRPAPTPAPAPAPRPSGGGSVPRSAPAPHPAPAPAPHPSGGGGSHVTSTPKK